ncbi:MAG: hypothetical protein ACK5LZ_04820 [Anaerorhabdus sp.]
MLKKFTVSFMVLVLVGCSSGTTETEQTPTPVVVEFNLELELVSEEITIALGQDFDPHSIIGSFNGELHYPDIDTSVEGTIDAIWTVTYEDDKIERLVKVNVVNMNPTINGAAQEFTVIAGTSYSFEKITATDYLGNELEVEVLGDWNSKKVGRYPLQYYVVDENGYEAFYDFTFVTVANPNVGNSGSGSTGSNNSGSSWQVAPEGGSSGSETAYACPNAVYDKNLPCDAIIRPKGNEVYERFLGEGSGDICTNKGNELLNSNHAVGYSCSGISNNMGLPGGHDLILHYE